MDNKTQKIKSFLLMTLPSALLGYFAAYYGVSYIKSEGLAFFFLLVFGIGIPIFLISILVHELGHLVFGLATGFKFFSFQFLNLLFYKENHHIKFTFSRAPFQNAAGQCILYNHDFPSVEKKPYFWYNIGGLLFNLVLFLLGVTLMLVASGILDYVGWLLLLINAFFILSNGIPQSNDHIINNDGNTIKLCHQSEAELLGFYASINMHQKLAAGIELRDLEVTHITPLERANIFSLSTHLIELDQHMANLDYSAAKDLGQRLLENPNIKALYKDTILLEMLFIELIAGSPEDVIDQFDTKKLFAFSSETALRVQYAYGKFAGYDAKKLEKIKEKFDKQVNRTSQKGIVASAKLLFQEADIKIKSPTQ